MASPGWTYGQTPATPQGSASTPTPVSTPSWSYGNPTAAAAPKPKKSGGIGGFLKSHVPGLAATESAIGTATDTAASVSEAIGTGLYQYGKAAVAYGNNPSLHKIGTEWADFVRNPLDEAKQEYNTDPFVHATVQQVAPLAHPFRDPTQTALAAALIVAPGVANLAGRAVYAADVGNAARLTETGNLLDEGKLIKVGSPAEQEANAAGMTVTPLTGTEKTALRVKAFNPFNTAPTTMRSLKFRGTEVPLQASRSHLIRAGQGVLDTTMQKALDKGAINQGFGPIGKLALKRIGMSDEETARLGANLRAVPEVTAGELGSRSVIQVLTGRSSYGPGITQEEGKLAGLIRSTGMKPGDVADYYRNQAEQGINPALTSHIAEVAHSIDNKGLLTLDDSGRLVANAEKYPKFARADEAAATAQGLREQAVADTGRMTPEGRQARLDLVARVMAGGEHGELPAIPATRFDVGSTVQPAGKGYNLGVLTHVDQATGEATVHSPQFGGVKQMQLSDLEVQAGPAMHGGEEGIGKGQAYFNLKTSQTPAQQSALARAANKVKIGRAKPLPLGKTATGRGVPVGLLPKDFTSTVVRDLHDANRVLNTEAIRALPARLGSDLRETKDDVLMADPEAEKYAEVPEVLQQLLGLKEKTAMSAEQETGVSRALEALLHDRIRSSDEEIGARAPEGWKWVPKQALPDSLTKVATARGSVEKGADTLNSAVTAATIYYKLGHVPTRVFTNATTNIMEGSAAPQEVLKTFDMVKKLGGLDAPIVRKLDALTGGHGYTALPHAGQNIVGRVAGRGAKTFARKIDRPFRVNSILYNLRSIGIDTPEKIEAAVKQFEDPSREGVSAASAAQIDWAFRRSNRSSIMYDGMSQMEKRRIARYLWFYPWTKGAVRFAAHSLAEHPVKSYGVIKVGQYGAQVRQQQLGNVPDYELGLNPLSGGENPLTNNLETFTPFSTFGQVAQIVKSPQNVVQQLNPVYSGIAQATSDAIEGKGTGNAIQDFLGQSTSPAPESQIISALLHPNGKGFVPNTTGKRLFGNSWQSALLRGLGGPAVARRTSKSRLAIDYAHQHEPHKDIRIYPGG